MAAAHGYIGRSPSDSSTVIARQSFSPTGIQTDFTFAAGYSVGYVDLYLNGARLIEGQDFTATDGSTVGLTTNAVNGDVLEVVAFKAFNATSVSAAAGNFAVSQNLTVTGVSTFTGAITATGGVVGDATGLSGTPDITVRHLKATGISTVSDTTQSTTTTSGALIVSGGLGVAKNLFVGGSMNVAGTLTYEDVTNSETAGVTTTGGLVVTGLGATFGSGVGIADSIYHIDDSNTAIRFPAADNFTVTTSGSERFRVGPTGISTFTGNVSLIAGGAERLNLAHVSGGDVLIKNPTDAYLAFGTNDIERVRIENGGDVGIGTNNPNRLLQVEGGSGGKGQILISTHGAFSGTDTADLSLRVYSNSSNGNAHNPQAQIQAVGAGNYSAHLLFKTAPGGGDNNPPSERVRITPSGSVGIGTTNPQGTLEIDAASTTSMIMLDVAGTNFARLGHNSASGTNILDIRSEGHTRFLTNGNNERVRITSAGLVGVGTAAGSSSSTRLVVYEESGNGQTIEVKAANTGGAGSQPGIRFTAPNNDNIGAVYGDVNSDSLQFSTGATERLRISSDGQLNVNQANSNNLMGQVTIFEGTDFNTGSQLGRDNIYLISDQTSADNAHGASIAWSRVQYSDRRAAAIASVQTTSDEDQVGLAFFTHASTDAAASLQESVRIEHNGYMLIGTTTATGNTDRLLQVGDTSLSAAYIEVRTGTSGASGVVFSDNDDGSGTTGYRGTIEYIHSSDQIQFKTAGVTRLTCDSSGNFTATGNVTAYSDVTLKENIETIPNALDKVLNLRGVEFDRNDKENNPHEIGVIAQEVEEVVPEVVMTNEEGLKSVAYGNLVGLLIESIKELKAEVNDLKAQLEG